MGMDYFFGDGLVEPTQWTTPPNLDLGGAGALDAVAIDFTGSGTESDAMWDSDGDGVADRVVLAHDTEHAETYTDDGAGTWAVPYMGGAAAGSAAAGGALGGVGSLSPAALGGGSVAGGSMMRGGSAGGLGSLAAGSLALGAIGSSLGAGSAEGIDLKLPPLPELPPLPAPPELPNLCDVVCPEPVQGGIEAPAPDPAPEPAPEPTQSVEEALAGDTDHFAGPDPVPPAPAAPGNSEIAAIQGGIEAGSAAAMGSLDAAALGSTGGGVDAGSAAGSAAAGSLAAGSLGAGSAGGGSVGVGSVGVGSVGGGSVGGGFLGAGSLGAGSLGGAGLGVLSGSIGI